ncbi:Stk1 family PASTA domain-containing Ser/Thr kinase [Staphylospora marina]|uniref:Stk1 family PASTA domain-containing Ser/Thr kinase n=1 Tax=Staphylospora marina TaxID=2490858 RepID=UPI001F14AFE0|nr:Stk1 family PASTA domain-containing Ser/Thr kinase [Staphylospora marina]
MEGKKLGGRYEVLSRIGGGGMAVVYKAKDLLLGRYVAIKILSESLSNDSEFIRRFSREAQAAASLSHPNVVNVYDVGRDGYTHYIVMELVEGPTLKQYIQERGPLPPQEAAAIAVQICDGLAHAHDNQIVHRDIKPHNILLGSNGRAKVTDFGIARAASSSTITQTGSVMGSVHYFSPEQARGGVIGEKSDIYSLGIVLYEMLTGEIPFDGDSAISIALKHLQEIPEDPRTLNPSIPEAMARIVLRALEKDPNKRFASAREMMKELQVAARMEPAVNADWMSPRKQEVFQTIPLGEDEPDRHGPVATAMESDYASPVQRPEIRSGHTVRGTVQNPIGQQTMANLERLRNVPSDRDKTIFQRTVIWLENVQANLPMWQKILFGSITVVLILLVSAWVFNAIWGFISKDKAGNPGETQAQVTIPQFNTYEEAVEFAKKHNLPEPEKSFDSDAKDVETGTVTKQTPSPGDTLTGDTKIQVWLAPDMLPVPNFVGKKENNVRDALVPQYDTLGFRVEAYHCDEGAPVEKWVVYKQEPEKWVAPNGTVRYYIHAPGFQKCSKAKKWSQ